MADRLAVLAEAPDARPAETRAEFVHKALKVGGVAIAGGIGVAAWPHAASGAPSPRRDMEILNVVLLLEHMEAAFYAETVKRARVNRELLTFAKIAGEHERQHVALLRKILGKKARKRPSFDFGTATADSAKFASTAALLEDTMVAAYNGQAANLTKAALASAAQIVSVEARHAGWIRAISGMNPAPDPTDAPKTVAEVTAVLNRVDFVQSA